MEEESSSGCQLRRRRGLGNRRLDLNLDVGFQISEGASHSQATPSPSYMRLTPSSVPSSARLLQEFKNKQQSFDIQVEDCEEIEIIIESDEEGEEDENAVATVPNRPITPTPVQDFGTSVLYMEGPQATDFLKVKTIEQDCYTDVSDAGSDDEEQ
ncbi:uncharacterized protein LOC116778897 [Danaus plexippus]|uniref:Uncharacterized protein n=1 Tax=Danaus plexippus plexippus TaxID=278856 RepID=A0A212EL96_DANPL|nr:uncharacterized protein LOC116778897 [Danaus plexippus]OWR42256.1 hypothetical protein KGM_201935 [Danaus plexippus plexippus]